MNQGFWTQLDTPIFALAPMEDVTDAAFRRMFAKYGAPDVMFTEFTSADGLLKGGWDRLKHQLWYEKSQRPIVAQLFSDNPQSMRRASRLCRNLGFDGIDINMCCPSKTVCDNGCGSALIKKPDVAKKIINAAAAGAEDIPVSVKTRIGYEDDMTDAWISQLLEAHPAAISIHARTRSEMSDVPARWSRVARAVELRDAADSDTLIIGNGDVWSMQEAQKRYKQTGCDGVMIGRAAFGAPWFFKDKHKYKSEENIEQSSRKVSAGSDISKRLSIMHEHTRLYDSLFGGRKNFRLMRKHFKAYAKGFPHAKELRIDLMNTDNISEVQEAIEAFKETHLQSNTATVHV